MEDLGSRQASMSRPTVLHRASRAVLLAVVALAPLPFGSVEPLWLSIWMVLLAVALGLADFRRLRPVHLALLAPLLAAALVYGTVVALQSGAIPGLLPDYPLHARAAALLGGALLDPVATATREPAWHALGPALATLLALLAGFVAGSDRDLAVRLVRVVAWACLAYAVFGLAMMIIDPRLLLWREKMFYLGRLTGTFVNANTAATYFGMGTAIWTALLCASLRRHLPEDDADLKDVLRLGFSQMPREIMGAALAALVLLGATLATGSRAGSLFTVVAVCLVVLLSFRDRLTMSGTSLVAVAGAAVVGLGLIEIWGGTFGQRVQAGGVVDYSRVDIFRSGWAMVADHPWWGTGLGTFEMVFPAYRSDQSVAGIVDRAHNTPLEVAAELGLPVAGAVVLAALVTLALIFRGALTRRRNRKLPILGVAVGTLAFLHALVDFHLQIPGFAIPFWAVTGAALAQSVSGAHHGGGRAAPAIQPDFAGGIDRPPHPGLG
jgi:O-antigen ligase